MFVYQNVYQMDGFTTKLDLDTRHKGDEENRQFPIRLRITIKRKRTYFKTGKKATKAEWAKMTGKRVPEALKNTITDLNSDEALARRILESMSKFDVKEFKTRFASKDQSMVDAKTLEYHFKKYEKELWSLEKVKTARNYGSARASLLEFYKTEFNGVFLITDVDAFFLKKYQHWMTKKKGKENGKSITTVSMYMRCLHAIINRAIDLGGFSDEKKHYPFGKNKYQIPPPLQKKRALLQSEVKLLEEFETPDIDKEFAKDMFLFSYYSGGPNPVDIAKFEFSWIKNNHIHLPKRSKNINHEQESIPPVYIDKSLKKIIEKHKANSGSYVFGIISDDMDAKQVDERVNRFIKRVNLGLKNIAADDIEFHVKPTFGIARHTQANILRTKGVPMDVIQKGMGHSSIKMTKSYLKPLETEKPNSALSKLRISKTA
jgi:integrase/recombinase XerD